MRAIVIGSGIAGLAVAHALYRIGISVTIYERASQLTEVGAGISLWANALRALDHLGIGQSVRSIAQPMTLAEFRCRNGFTITASFEGSQFERQYGTAPFLAMVHRAELVESLAAGLPEGTAQYGYECVNAESRADRAIVQFQNGHSDTADLVIGADGIHSTVRSGICVTEAPRYAGYTCWRGVCPHPASIPSGYFAEWWGRGKRFGIATLTQDRVYWWATQNAPAGRRHSDEHADLLAAFTDWADPVPTLIGTTAREAVLRNDIIDRPPHPAWTAGRVLLIGDAAHPTTPNLGQGGCQALEDAVVLGQCLCGTGALEDRLAAFVTQRFPRTAAITNESWRFGRIGQWQGQLACWLRDLGSQLLLPRLGPATLPKYAVLDVGPLPTSDLSRQAR